MSEEKSPLLALAEQAEQNLGGGGQSLPGLDAPPEAEQVEVDNDKKTLGQAAFIVAVTVKGVNALFPMLHYPDEIQQKAAEHLAPLLAKYGGDVGFLQKWQAEIEAGMFFGGIAWGSYLAVKEYKASQQEKPAAPAGGDGASGD